MLLRGIGAAPGFAVARCQVLRPAPEFNASVQTIMPEQIETELRRFGDAVVQATAQLEVILQRARRSGDKIRTEIMEAQCLMLADPTLEDGVRDKIGTQLFSALKAVQDTIAEQTEILAGLEDPYLRERAADVRDIGLRLTNILQGKPEDERLNLVGDVILVGKEITTSLMAALDSANVKGIVAEVGGKTSHTAILANNMGLPAVLGCAGILDRVREDELLAIDGDTGIVELALSGQRIATVTQEMARRFDVLDKLWEVLGAPTQTRDGFPVHLTANIMDPAGAVRAMRNGADGIGLYRTEFLFMGRNAAPTEEEQYEAYAEVVRTMGGKPVIIRTLDIGGDKEVSYMTLAKEANPFLGYRAIRICLQEQLLFMTQLRAILRAGAHGRALIMYPMIASLEEVRAANQILAWAKESLKTEGVAFDAAMKSGIMVETPAAAVTADLLIQETDFFSIGSNDLTQYSLAVDRMNEKISSLYCPFHPGVLRLICSVIDAANRAGGDKFVGMCGEMAADPAATLLLLGLGLTEFSVNPTALLKIKKIITSVDKAYAHEVAARAMQLPTAAEVYTFLQAAVPTELRRELQLFDDK